MIAPPPETVILPSGPVRVEWRRSARARKVSLRVDQREGVIVVTLPPRASHRAGMALLMGHVDWVTQRLRALPESVPFADGAIVPIHGVPHRIRHVLGARRGAWVVDGELHVSGAPEFLRRRVSDFLGAEARRHLVAFVTEKAALAGVKVLRVTVRDTSSRWGSCSSQAALSFSWRLVMAPPFVQDYVAAHEVSHIRHMNHGDQFWAQVARLTPHTKAAVAWLKQHGPGLHRVG